MMEFSMLLFAAVVLGFIFFWIYQFVQLMLLSDADFPGRYDKCLWTAAFIAFFVVAPFAFFGWKFAYRAMLAAKAGDR
jgi:hypothetical protein